MLMKCVPQLWATRIKPTTGEVLVENVKLKLIYSLYEFYEEGEKKLVACLADPGESRGNVKW